jgi:hydrogenase nickel incorporation protein HypA/HybF
MHEFSIAEGLVRTVLDEMQQRQLPPGSVRTVTVYVGRMRQVVPESLSFAFDCLTEHTPAQGAQLITQEIPVQAQCRTCGWQGEVCTPLFRCQACLGPDLNLVTGRELYLGAMEVETLDNP